MKLLHLIIATLFFILPTIFPVNTFANGGRETRLNALIEEALENNPRIKAAYNSWKSEEFKITPSRHVPDPVVQYGFYGESVETRVGPMEQKLGASLKVPFPGKLKQKGESQTKTAEIAKEYYESVKREVIKNLKSVYFDIFWVDKAIQVTEGEKAILGELESVARKKYETNMTHQQDVVKAQVEISTLIDKLILLRENRKSLVARINSILNRPIDATFGSAGGVGPQKLSFSKNQLNEMANETRQELKSAELAVKRAEHERALAQLEYVPDFTFGVDYTWVGKGHTAAPNDGKDAWIGLVSVNIPLWFGKIKTMIEDKKSALRARKQNYEDMRNTVSYEVDDLYYQIRSYGDTINLYQTALIPQAEQAFDSARIGYESGAVDFLNWLDSERTLLQTRLSYYRAVVDYQKALANMEKAVGRDL